MKVEWSAKAVVDLVSVRRYIALTHPEAVKAVVTTIFNFTENQLRLFPESGTPGRRQGTRELVVPRLPYIVPYRVDGDVVRIIRVLHTSRKWPTNF